MKRSLRTSDLHSMSPAAQQARISEFAKAMREPANGELRALDQEIAGFERTYDLPSSTMQSKVLTGEIPETFEFCRWQMLIELRAELGKSSAQAG